MNMTAAVVQLYCLDAYRTRLFTLLATPLGLALVIVDDGDPRQLVGRVVLVLA